VELVAVGHVTLDRVAGAVQPGGAAYYAAVTARRLGLRPRLLTSFGPDFPVRAIPDGIDVVNVESRPTTTFRVDFDSAGQRRFTVEALAAPLGSADFPAAWMDAPLVMLCPVAGEVDPGLAAFFPEASLAALPQGWMRALGEGGRVEAATWESAAEVLPHTQLLALSHEDVTHDLDQAREWLQRVPLAVVTQGRRGAILFVNGERYHVEADPAREVDATGAGDVFATALLVAYQRDGNPWEAAATAACVAAASVEGQGASAIPDPDALEGRLAAYRRRRDG
jgi:sugar/nucleoside kinase (ribokinase family)